MAAILKISGVLAHKRNLVCVHTQEISSLCSMHMQCRSCVCMRTRSLSHGACTHAPLSCVNILCARKRSLVNTPCNIRTPNRCACAQETEPLCIFAISCPCMHARDLPQRCLACMRRHRNAVHTHKRFRVLHGIADHEIFMRAGARGLPRVCPIATTKRCSPSHNQPLSRSPRHSHNVAIAISTAAASLATLTMEQNAHQSNTSTF